MDLFVKEYINADKSSGTKGIPLQAESYCDIDWMYI